MKLRFIVLFLTIGCMDSEYRILEKYPSGKVKKKCSKTKCFEFTEDGDVLIEYNHSNGILNGEYKKYSQEGNRIFNYENGIVQGESLLYYADGGIRAIENYVDGVLKGNQFIYDDQGVLRKKSYYLNIRNEKFDIVEELLFNEKGDTIADSRDIIEYALRDTFKVGETATLNINYKKFKLDQFLVYYGDQEVFDDFFYIKDSLNIDTVFLGTRNNFDLSFPARKVGINYLRGVVMNLDTVETIADTAVVLDHIDRHFEFKFVVVQ